MVWSPARHPLRLAPFSQPCVPTVFPLDVRRLSIAPLPFRGVTPPGMAFPAIWAGITLPSPLLWAHAPIPIPPVASGYPSVSRSLQVVVSPCWEKDLPDVISANLSLHAWTPTPAAPVVLLPVSSHRTSAFPTLGQVSAKHHSAQQLQRGLIFRGCSHSFIFRPAGLLATQVAPTTDLPFVCRSFGLLIFSPFPVECLI
jgi:hypothetical protein